MKELNKIKGLVAELQSGIVCVTFTKINGDKREMHCTLKPELIPEDMTPKGTKQVDDDKVKTAVAVYDVVSDGWRSFRSESVIEWY